MDWSSGKWVPGPNVFFVVCCNFLLTRLSCRTSIIVAGNLRRLNARVTSRWRHDDVRVKTVNPTQYSRRQVSVRNYFNSTSSMWNASLKFFHHNANVTEILSKFMWNCRYKFLHMTRELCCHGMCKISLRCHCQETVLLKMSVSWISCSENSESQIRKICQ